MYFNATFELPDDVIIDTDSIPQLSIKCLKGDESYTETVEIITEPLVDPNRISELKVDKDSVILFKFKDGMAPEDINMLREILQAECPNNKVIGIHEDINVLAMHREEAIEMLNKMVARIKIMGQ